ncbi:MAG: 3-isopropylmalate dehydratase large subunit [bacterium]|nr:3-isopropylmalate dehydratase large subunit [bacterium]
MSKGTLYNKVWDRHKVTTLPSGLDQLIIGLHMIHEVTSPQAFAMLKEKGSKVAFPERTVATMDHIVPTDNQFRPFFDTQAELMAKTLEENTKEYGITFLGLESGKQGVVHIVGPENGYTQPGMTIACGDSHTSTHGAFGALAFGIGTTEVRNILETQTLALSLLKVKKICVNGTLRPGVTAKDVILAIIAKLGVKGGIGFAYEYTGDVFENMTMEERMTVCNMSIEGGARIGYINPDQTTYDYIKGRDKAPSAENWDKAVAYWESIRSDADAVYDDEFHLDAADIEPMVTWGINPGQGIGITENLPNPAGMSDADRETAEEAYVHMQLQPGTPIKGTKIDVAFIGSCTNGRISDLREAAKIFEGRKVASHVQALVVPGSQQVKAQAEQEGLDKIFIAAGAEWRGAGCSMCLAMNTDKLKGDQISASSSNRNFIGRQGSATGRTLLMSPAMVAAAAINGVVSDVRELQEVTA